MLSFDVPTGADGSAAPRFLVPGDALQDAYQLIATGPDRSETASSPFTVLPSSDCPPDQQPEC